MKEVKLSEVLRHEDMWGSGDMASSFLILAQDGGELGVKRSGREGEQSSCAKIRDMWGYISTLPHIFSCRTA
jgi:hypothetical protein